MKIRRLDEQTVGILELDLFCCELIQQIVLSAQVDDCPAARERLFSRPTQGRERSFEEDWKEFVEPDLRDLFRSAQEVVASDLKEFPSPEPQESYHLKVPVRHLEAWIHTLNQARLALVARNGFSESELEESVPLDGDARALALFQVHFYGFLQECFLRQLE